MKKLIFNLTILLLYIPVLFAQDLSYSALTIPDSLKTNANAVIRYESTDIEVLSSSKMNLKKEMVVTVLNKRGNGDGYIYLQYDNYDKIKSVSAKIYNALGMEIKKIKWKDFTDVSAVDGGTLYSDNRVLYYQHVPLNYPYTISYEYETTTSNTAFIPNWLPVKHFYASTQKSIFKLKYPADIKIYSKEQNLDAFNMENNSRAQQIAYTLHNAKAIENEQLSPIFYQYGPHVKFATNKFHIAGVDGQAENWKEYGTWVNDNLLAGTNEIPESVQLEIKNLVKGVADIKERARLVYDYMQDKTRYISVQIGIGGWKPMPANEVETLGYGDCKALTNYTKSLLKAADVNALYTIIYANRRRDFDKDLAAMQGNHAILMVPTKKDTVWLECTSQKAPFGYLGKFTDDRDALVVTPEGGKIVRTKAYTDAESKQIIFASYNLDAKGNISATAKIESSGIQYDNHYYIADLDNKEKDAYYKEFFDQINNITIEHIAINNNDLQAVFTEDIAFTATNYAVNSGERMLLRINAFNVNANIPKRYRNRKQALEIPYGFIDRDEVLIGLPLGYQIESMANEAEVITKFGTYKISFEKINDQQIKYKRELLVKQGMYSVEDYEKYRKFRKKINQLDNSKIVLIKNQTL